MRKPWAYLALFLLIGLGLSGCEDTPQSEPHIIKQEIGEGPFGLEAGSPKNVFGTLEERDLNFYKTYNVPRNNTAFEFYEVQFAETGLCMLQAIGIDIETDPAGENLKFEFDRLAEALDKKYIKSDDFRQDDETPKGSKPKSWMKKIVDEDQIHEKYWFSSEDANFKGGVRSISLRTKALSEEIGYFVLRYEFDNYPDCEAMEKAAELDNL